MILYRILYGINAHETLGECHERTLWVGTQAEAKKAKKRLMDEGAYDIEVEPMDIPTNKAGLIEALNQYAGKP